MHTSKFTIMADKRAFELSTLIDQASAYILADRDDLAEAQKQLIINIITQAILQVFDPTDTDLTATNTQDAIKELLELIKTRLRWSGVWDETTQYVENDVVRADTWLMVASVPLPAIGVTPIPTPSENPYYVINLSDSPTWETVNTTSWFYTGLRATNNTGPLVIRGGRFWLQNTSGIRQLAVLSLIDSDGDSSEIGSKTFEDGSVTTTGWEPVVLPESLIVYKGQIYEIGLFTESLGGETSLYNDTWVYNGVNNDANNVYYGSATQSSSATILYMHRYSYTGTENDFSTLLAGDIIVQTAGASEWAFELDATPTFSTVNTDVWEITGAYLYKIGEINSAVVVDYDIVRPGEGPLDYVKITDGLAGYDNLEGYLDTIPTNDVYGVDFFIDDIIENPQWDIMSNIGGGSGGGAVVGDDTTIIAYIPITFNNSPNSNPYTFENGKTYAVYATDGEVTCNLPLAPNETFRIRVYLGNSTSNEIHINGNGNNIEGLASQTYTGTMDRSIIEFTYNKVDIEWKENILNSEGGGGGASAWEDLTDVTTKVGYPKKLAKVSDDESLMEWSDYDHDQVSNVKDIDVSTWETNEIRPLGVINNSGTPEPEKDVPVLNVYSAIDSVIVNLLEDDANWSSGEYIGTAITGIYQGQRYVNTTYLYEFFADNTPLRILRS